MLEKIKEVYLQNKKVVFKMYGVEYTIEDLDNKVMIYQTSNNLRNRTYDSIDSLLDNYNIYGENIKENEKYIESVQ